MVARSMVPKNLGFSMTSTSSCSCVSLRVGTDSTISRYFSARCSSTKPSASDVTRKSPAVTIAVTAARCGTRATRYFCGGLWWFLPSLLACCGGTGWPPSSAAAPRPICWTRGAGFCQPTTAMSRLQLKNRPPARQKPVTASAWQRSEYKCSSRTTSASAAVAPASSSEINGFFIALAFETPRLCSCETMPSNVSLSSSPRTQWYTSSAPVAVPTYNLRNANANAVTGSSEDLQTATGSILARQMAPWSQCALSENGKIVTVPFAEPTATLKPWESSRTNSVVVSVVLNTASEKHCVV
mmetsp:Transcript_3907/g.12110  ORF Transcript_3907/g.12110 Transcript_3907/m.12110 type:complete len:298 (-) Transcript_3907:452-1345(-)